MSLIPSFFPKTPFNWDPMYNRTLDLFDPFNEIDQALNKNLHWFLKPDIMGEQAVFPRVPQKYRITVDCAGFSPPSIKTELSDNNQRLTVSAHEESRTEGSEDFHLRQFKKTYTLPKNAYAEQMASFMTGDGQLVIEVPLREEADSTQNLFPQIVDAEGGGKQVMMKFTVPPNIDPHKLSVSVKGHDLIFRAEDVVKKPDGVSKLHYFQRTSLPEHTQLDSLRCFQDNNQVTVTAPLTKDFVGSSYRKVPIEGWNQQKQQKQIPHGKQQSLPQGQTPKTQTK